MSIPANILVAGAGTATVNGTYTYRGLYQAKPYYNLVGEPDSISESSLGWDTDRWYLFAPNGDIDYWTTAVDVAYPNLGIWEVKNGDSPAPTVTAIPAGTDAVLRKASKAEMGVVCVLDSVTVDLNTTALQLSQVVVPTGKICVVTGEIVRNASVDLTGIAGRWTTGWNAGADNLWTSDAVYNFDSGQLGLLSTTSLATGRSSLYPRNGDGTSATTDNALLLVGKAGETLGFKTNLAFGSAATVTVDVLGYFA